MDLEWESYAELSNRQIIRKSPVCRVNITIFAAARPSASSTHVPCQEPIESEKISMEVPRGEPTRPIPNEGVSEKDGNTKGNSCPIDHDFIDDGPIGPVKIQDTNPKVQSKSSQKSEASQRPPEHGPRFLGLPREEQAMLKRAHQNLCHPSAECLSAVLRTQGCRPELMQAVFDMRCSTCATMQQLPSASSSTFKDALDFNDTCKVFIDGITWTSQRGKMFHFYHLIDQAANFHVAVPTPNRAADQAIAKASEAWFQWAGPPNTLVMDPATEFTSEEVETFSQRHDVRGVVTAPHAHWQNGRCERHGKILQSMLD